MLNFDVHSLHRRSILQQPSSLCRTKFGNMGTNRKLYLGTTKTFSTTFFQTRPNKLSFGLGLKHWHTLFWCALASKVETVWATVCQADWLSVSRWSNYLAAIIYLPLDRSWFRPHSKPLTIPCTTKSDKQAIFDIIGSHSLLRFLYPYHSHIKAKYLIVRKTQFLFQMTWNNNFQSLLSMLVVHRMTLRWLLISL